jgi:1-acyl-sn-glycerol-3-phosphate acyltransferase
VSHRRFGHVKAALGLAGALSLAPPWLLLRPESRAAKALERRFHQLISHGFGLTPRVIGAPAGPGSLIVANHISWADIPALASVLDADFIAKADVAGYPLLGALARRTGTIFVERERRSQAGAQMGFVRARLQTGRRVVLFPEGTTSDGAGLLPFRSSLFAAADAARQVQPVTLRYTMRGGEPIDPDLLGRIAWIGDEAMLPNAAKLAAIRVGIRIIFHAAVDPAGFASRKALADHCRDVVAAGYSNQAAAPKRSP